MSPAALPLLHTTSLCELYFESGKPLAAASGLVCLSSRVCVVGDDLKHLGVFDSHARPGQRLRLLPGGLPKGPKARKRVKPDFEILLEWRGGLLALGSGSSSRPTRDRAVHLPSLQAAPLAFALTLLYERLRAELGPLNLEGALLQGDELWLLQRGNAGGLLGNARIRLHASVLEGLLVGAGIDAGLALHVEPMALGELDGVPLGFTDACALPAGHWLFSAAAEDTDDAVADGRCAGSVIGLATAAGQVLRRWRVGGDYKVEGIDARALPGGLLELAMVCDADDPTRASPLLVACVDASVAALA
ncbi:DUF6929 family protein [Roseateles paludis]|jgi:hypothetical protein|uniref:Uncharacterized protein n=1 Tax=Roseateles paludis TaxID=3145238 RepID=A0ABV0FXA3_9BURK